MYQVLIAGYYGFGNLGDEAILVGIVRRLKEGWPGARLRVTHGGFSPVLPDVEPVPWNDLPALVEAAHTADLIVLGGGGIFFDYWAFEADSVLTRRMGGVTYYATFPLLATLLRKPLAIWAVGVGPFRSEAARRLTRLSFLQADYASVRDPDSAAVLAELGIEADRVTVAADPAFDLEPVSRQRVEQILRREGVPFGRPLLGVALRQWDVGVDPEVWVTAVAAALDRFVVAHDLTAIFIPFQQVPGHLTDDRQAALEVAARMSCPDRVVMLAGNYSPEEVAGLLAQCDLVVGMRLHSVVLAAVAGTPAVCLVYDPKVRAAARRLGLEEYAVEIANLNAENLLGLLEAAWTARAELRDRVRAAARELREAAAANARRVAALMGSAKADLAAEVETYVRELALVRSLRLYQLEGDLAEREQAIAGLQAEVQAKAATIAQLEGDLAEREQAIARLQAEVQAKEATIAQLQAEVAARGRQLETILKSDAWALVQFIWWLRPKVAPTGSLRERALRLAFKPFRAVVRYGFRGFLAAGWSRLRQMMGSLLGPRGPFRDEYVVEDNTHVILYADNPDLFSEYQPRRRLRDVKRLRKVRVSLIAPVKNEAKGIYWWWEGIIRQTRLPDEIIVVDGGSTDGTVEILKELAAKSPVPFRVIEEPGANIARARNLAIQQAQGDVIACIDFGCRPEADWLEKLVAPFEDDPEVRVSCGWYRAVGPGGRPVRYRGLVPELRKIHPATFIPSSRSVAFTKEACESVGGYPEWLTLTGEDTYFSLELKRLGGKWAFVPEAIVQWEAPSTVWSLLKKMFVWSIGDGESGVHGRYYWRYALALGGIATLGSLTGLAAILGLMLGGPNLLWPVLFLPVWVAVYKASKAVFGARPAPLVLLLRAAAVLGFIAGSRHRDRVQRRRWGIIKGLWFVLSGVPIDDTGGGARATQIALELLRQGHFVVFISRFPKYESKELGLKFVHPNLRTYRIQEFDWEKFVVKHSGLMESVRLAALVEFPVAEFLPVIDAVRAAGGRVIYDLIDDWSTSLGGDWYSPEVERAIIEKSDVLTATAPVLAERLREWSGREVHLLPNAVNDRLFDPGRWYPRPADLPQAAWRMIYVGALWGEWFDWDLLLRLADAYPEAAVVVIGDYRGQCPEARANLHFLGLKAQRDLPAYLAYSDVAIIPWKVNEITRATSPLKVYEYLAMHKPVVAPDIPPLRGIPGVSLASDGEEFVKLVARARLLPFPDKAVREFISRNNWGARVATLSAHLWS